MINLCDKHKIYPDIKVVSVTEINNVYTALDSGNTSTVRYVLDLENTLKDAQEDLLRLEMSRTR